MRTLNGGCQVPIGVNASLENGILKVRAILGLPNGTEILRECLEVQVKTLADCERIGYQMAQEFVRQGAEEILQKAQNWEFN